MSDKFRDECAVFGIWDHEEAARITYLGLYSMQHRGQESAGIVSIEEEFGDKGLGRCHHQHKGVGLVGDVFGDEELSHLKGRGAIGHVRYSTTGRNLLSNVQPLTANLYSGPIALAHNGNIVNSGVLRRDLQKRGAIFQGTNDTETLLHILSRIPSRDMVTCLKVGVQELVGAYSFVALTKDALVAIRDPMGFRPLVLGEKVNSGGRMSTVVASETCALDLIGAQYLREIEPGEIFWVDRRGRHSEKFVESGPLRQCIFEHVYFARPDSVVFGHSVYQSRKNMGRVLAQETGVAADLVIPVPDSGIPAAMGYSEESQVPFDFGIIRNHYVGRTFIQPHQSIRDFEVKIKLNPQSALLRGKRVVMVDDSLVRGTTSKKIVSLIRQAGAHEVHVRIACPPTKGPCFYGVDTPQKSQLIAAHQSVEDIRHFIGADSLAYLSLEGMEEAMKGEKGFCMACFDGKYPTPLFKDRDESDGGDL